MNNFMILLFEASEPKKYKDNMFSSLSLFVFFFFKAPAL